MKISPYHKYLVEKQNQYNLLLSEYDIKIDKAKHEKKGTAHFKFYYSLIEHYRKRQKSLGNLSRYLIEINDELDEDKDKIIETEFNKKYLELKGTNTFDFLKEISNLEAENEFIKYLHNEELKYKTKGEFKLQNQNQTTEKNSVIATTNIHWKKNNKTEFIQLIYALFEAGYLSNSENEITKILEDAAKIFNIKLSEHWQSNFSKSIRKNNFKNSPEIIKKLGDAYKSYANRTYEERTKKK